VVSSTNIDPPMPLQQNFASEGKRNITIEQSHITGISTTGATDMLIGIILFGLDADAADSLSGTVNLTWSLCSAFNKTADPSLVIKKTRRKANEQANMKCQCVSVCNNCHVTVANVAVSSFKSSQQFQRQCV
jgi:hypothetical protein